MPGCVGVWGWRPLQVLGKACPRGEDQAVVGRTKRKSILVAKGQIPERSDANRVPQRPRERGCKSSFQRGSQRGSHSWRRIRQETSGVSDLSGQRGQLGSPVPKAIF